MTLQPEPTIGDTSWFTHDRFGMFIHWGLYAQAARHEWVKNVERMTDEHYQRYFDHFNPDRFDPRQWAKAARQAGMKYLVITSKHHEGFCLWDSKYTDYKATNTPYGKDLLKQVVEAYQAEGLRVGFYYSLIDWHHPHFPIDGVHPYRDDPRAAELNQGRDITLYAEYLRNQVGELLTQFGQVDILWLDFSYPNQVYKGMPGKGRKDWESEKLYQLIRKLAPQIVLNNRMDYDDFPPDVYTPEQFQPTEWVKDNGKPVVWETCQTFSGSWGYHRDEATWKSPEQLIRMLINTVSCGGNLLMNVGPTARGTFDGRAIQALQVYADWMSLHSRSIYGCTQSDFTPPTDVRYTQNGNRLYAHLYAWPFRHLVLPGLAGKVAYAQLLNDASEVPFKEAGVDRSWDENELPEGTLLLSLPVVKPDVVVPVIEIFLK
jgi:alpha-L-fucosidase